jgi:hypothetical protein
MGTSFTASAMSADYRKRFRGRVVFLKLTQLAVLEFRAGRFIYAECYER